jgi:hypothetical protein
MKKKALCIFLAILLTGCASLAEKAGGLLDGSTRKEKILRRYRSPGRGIEFRELENSGKQEALILLEQIPTVKLRVSSPDSQGRFYVESLEFLAGSISGWHEFSLAVSGYGSFTLQGETASLRLAGPIAPLEITRGKIRLNERRINGEEALSSLRNRYERIKALTDWMKNREGVSLMAGSNRENFEKYWKPLLLPEITRSKQRPEAYKSGGAWVRAEYLSWNADYTADLFPEELAEYRNSGALLRDWEETVEWIYLEYAWDRIFRILQDDSINLKLYQKSWPFGR